jgi:pimeloyl-ACP methyl ester carboxylesterase
MSIASYRHWKNEIRVLKYKLRDSRILSYAEYGKPNGYPTFFFHGSPSSHLEGAYFHECAMENEIRIIAVDRPGIGESTFMENRKIIDFPNDIVQLADSLGFDKFGIVGWSGGGPVALASAKSISDRLSFVIALGSAAPMDWDGSLDLLHKADRTSAMLSMSHPSLFLFLYSITGFFAKNYPESFRKQTLKRLCDSDKKIWSMPFNNGNIGDWEMKAIMESFRQGRSGAGYDAITYFRDWGFKLSEIEYPVHLWHGTSDTLVSIKLGEHIAETIPKVIFRPISNEGHFFLIEHMKEIILTAKAEINK